MSEMDESVIAYKFLQNFILSEPLYKTVEFDAKWYSSFAGFSRMIDHDFCDYCSENSVFEWSYPTKGTTLFIIYLHSKIKTNRQA